MLEAKQFSTVVDGKTITIETGKLARLAGGAVTVRQGDTLILVTATMGKTPREGINFFPLSVDYEERMYAGGRIPGSFFRREGRPSEGAIVTARLTDRPLRPLFPKDLRNDVQIIIYALSHDGETPVDVLAIVGASAALTISDIPFAGPVAAVRVSIIDGQYVFNPTYQQVAASDLDLRLAGTGDAIMMVECAGNQVPEDVMVGALEAGQKAMQPLIELQEQMRAELGKPKRSYPSFALPEGIDTAVADWIGSRIDDLISAPSDKTSMYTASDDLRDEMIAALSEAGTYNEKNLAEAYEDLYRARVRTLILDQRRRLDGRQLNQIRPIDVEVDLSPRAHGAGLFTRGETQVLTLATLGTPRERQELDNLNPSTEKRYMHHYNFPPFSVGETRMLRGASRRDIGHGSLAENALVPVIPDQEAFPYTIRLVSEVLASNGSSSMASVCASTLALLDAGVPIKDSVAGIAMGLVKEGDKFAVLTDIMGAEDHLGDMDFKVAGTRSGITALQMDIKIKGITSAIMAQALDEARRVRLELLDIIAGIMPSHRPALKPHAPRMTVIKIDPKKIGAVIGPGGKMVRQIQEETGVTVDIQEDGTIYIASVDGPSSDTAVAMIEGLTEEAIVGRIYTGKVVRTTNFGAFVEIIPGTDGMVHISQMASERIENVEDVARVGDELTVMVTDISPDGRVRLSRQAVLEGWSAEEALEKDRKPKPSGGGGPRPGGRSGGSGSRDRRR